MEKYLYEECKNAPNYKDFIKSIDVTLDDIEYLHDNGFVETYNKLIMKKLLEMDEKERPIHCIDEKEGKMIVKKDNVWDENCFDEMVNYSNKYLQLMLLLRFEEWMDKKLVIPQ